MRRQRNKRVSYGVNGAARNGKGVVQARKGLYQQQQAYLDFVLLGRALTDGVEAIAHRLALAAHHDGDKAPRSARRVVLIPPFTAPCPATLACTLVGFSVGSTWRSVRTVCWRTRASDGSLARRDRVAGGGNCVRTARLDSGCPSAAVGGRWDEKAPPSFWLAG